MFFARHAAFCSCPKAFKSTPDKVTEPDVGVSRQANSDNRVDLPVPEGPIMATLSPLLICKSKFENSEISPSRDPVVELGKDFDNRCASIANGGTDCMKIFRLLVLLALFITQGASAKTLLVLGDSLSAAYNMQTAQGWVALLEQRLKNTHPDIQVINSSISGETTSGGLTRLPKLLNRHQPDYIVLELAANDGLRGTPLNIIEKNLQKMIQLAKQSAAKVTLLGVRLPSNYGPRYTQKFFDIFEKLSISEAVYRVPFMMDKIALKPALMQADRLHPSIEAQPIILDNIWPVIDEMLSQ